jgi:hypothetical protein
MSGPSGFAYSTHRNGDVVITHNGRRAAQLRGSKAQRFLRSVNEENSQMLMARLTGNYKRGNER